MNNKKKYIITGSIAATALLVGGTAAFFTSSDSIINPFNTGGNIDDDESTRAGIFLEEDFAETIGKVTYSKDEDGKDVATGLGIVENGKEDNYVATNGETVDELLPGQSVNKDVRVTSDVDYAQYVRARVIVRGFTYDNKSVTQIVKDANGMTVGYLNGVIYYNLDGNIAIRPSGTTPEELERNLIEVYLHGDSTWSNGTATTVSSSLLTELSTPFYYNSILKPGESTSDLVNYVTLSSKAGNNYKNLGFEVNIFAESIQATQAAWSGSIANGGWAQTPTVPSTN